MRRVLCVWLPNWGVQRVLHEHPRLRGRALVLFADAGQRGLRVTACSAEAAQAGVRPGWPLAEARAMLSGVRSRKQTGAAPAWRRSDPAGDRESLQRLALDAQQFCPFVGIDDAGESLLLDITGCAHLWQDERGLLQEVVTRFRSQGYVTQAAIADTIGGAWGVAHTLSKPTIVPPGETAAALRPLPLEALRFPAAVISGLQDFGVTTVGGLWDLPRDSLPSRFGCDLLRRLDQATGKLRETFTPERFAEPLVEIWAAEEPLTDQMQLATVCRPLLDRLLAALMPQRAGLLDWRCRLQTVSGPVEWDWRLSQPTTDGRHLDQLFRLRCEREPLQQGVTGLRIEVLRAGLLAEQQSTLFEDQRDAGGRDLLQLVDRLTSRLGENAVVQPIFLPDPQPESSCRMEPWTSAPREHEFRPDPLLARNRPSRLLRVPQSLEAMSVVPDGPPLRLFWQGRRWNVHQSWGPERIDTGWWRTRDVRRDYYRVETEEGRHLWLFRRRDTSQWFLHGFFD